MGNTPSTEETARKLARDRALTLPLGSKIEQLFHEDFDPSPSTSSNNPSSSSHSKSAKQKAKRFSTLATSSSQDKWTPIPLAQTGFSDPAHLSKQANRSSLMHNIPDKPLPSGPPIGPGADFFLSPSDAVSRSSSKGKEKEVSPPSSISKKHDSGTAGVEEEEKPKVSNETPSSSSTYSAAESRWQERISKRIADRKVSDGVKAGLSQTAYMGTDLREGQKEEGRLDS